MGVVTGAEAARLRRGGGEGEHQAAYDEELRGRVLFTFFSELSEPVKKLAHTAWRARGKLAADVRAYIFFVTSVVCSMPGRITKVVNNPKLHEVVQEEDDPMALAAVVCGGSGALLVGSAGAVVGAVVGGAVGLAFGALPALLTFGLSLPIGAAVGGGGGLVAGAAIGGGAGAAGGSASGMTAAYFRREIFSSVLYIASCVYDVYDVTCVRPVALVRSTGRRVSDSVANGSDYTRAKANAVGRAAAELATDPRARVTAASAAAGGAALGTAGAATGALTGGTVGALVGVVPALFTFGLSIPIGAVVGGGAGLCVGGTVGTTAGFTGGGLAGYAGYAYRGAVSASYNFVAERALASARVVGLKAEANPELAAEG